MFASRGWIFLSPNADTYSVNVPMLDTIGRPGGLMLNRLASIMNLSGLELGQVDTHRYAHRSCTELRWHFPQHSVHRQSQYFVVC